MSDLDRCVGLLMHEAHLLDRQNYSASLSLWRTDVLYIVPTARDAAAETLDRLNHVYDDHDMRQRRVLRLQSGTALVTSPATTPSAVCLSELQDGLCHISSSLLLVASHARSSA